MGWMFTFDHTSRSRCIDDRIKDWDTRPFLKEEDKVYHLSTCLKQCYRGNAYSGVLWSVRETKEYDRYTDQLVRSELWIACDLLRYDNKDKCWGYKDMSESVGPNSYSCPLSYLDMVPIPKSEYAAGWREEVKKYHASRIPSFKVKKDSFVLLKENYGIRIFKITSLRPLKGIVGSKREYSIPRKSLLREITKEEIDQAKKEYQEHQDGGEWGECAEQGSRSKNKEDAILYYNDFLFARVKKNITYTSVDNTDNS
jgi:hypothetical protein